MRLTKLHEDLSDKDEFEPNCWCTLPDFTGVGRFDPDYHAAHLAAEAAMEATPVPAGGDETYSELMDKVYKNVMAQHGYIYNERDQDWIKK